MTQDQIPSLRFPEFQGKDSWEAKPLCKIANVIAGQSPEGSRYNKEGIGVPFYQGKTNFGDIYLKEPTTWTTQTTKIAQEGDILMSVRAPVGALNISTGEVCIGRGVASIQAKQNKWYLYYFLKKNEKYIVGNGGSIFDSINKSQIEAIKMLIPRTIEEQEKIAACLSSLDEVITIHGDRLDRLKEYKRGLMQQLFPADGQTTPTLRFPEFQGKDPWKMEYLGDNCSLTTGKLNANAMVENGQYRFYTCSKEYCFTDSYAFDTEALLISGNGNVGYIHHYKGKFNAYQRTYVLDKFSENILFIKYYLECNLRKRIALEKMDGNIPYIVKSALTDMGIMLPHKDEQQKIADCLLVMDDLITAQEQKIKTLKHHKNGLMQQLFPKL